MPISQSAWYCARTKPKHEHIATANLRRHLALPVFSPRIKLEKSTRRGIVRVTEPLFPCYVFVRCVIAQQGTDIQRVSGINCLVHFGGHYPPVPDAVVADLEAACSHEKLIRLEQQFAPGDEVTVASGAFVGINAQVLKTLPAKKRVQILLDILGRPTTVEVDCEAVRSENSTLVGLANFLAAPADQERVRT